jgi:hypothetical protein
MHGCIAYVHMQKSSTSQFQPLPHTHQKKSFNRLAYVHMQKSSTSQFQPLPHTHQKKSFNRQATGHHQDMHQNKNKAKSQVQCSLQHKKT